MYRRGDHFISDRKFVRRNNNNTYVRFNFFIDFTESTTVTRYKRILLKITSSRRLYNVYIYI